MKLKILLGLLFGGLFVWVVAAGVSGPAEREALVESLRTMNYLPLIPFCGLVVLYHVVRVWRWQRLLAPEYTPSFRSLFSINMVGFMAVNLLPARLGELAKPFLLSARERVPLSVGLATVLVERLLDFLWMLGILLFIAFGLELPVGAAGVKGVDYVSVVQRIFVVVVVPLLGGLLGLLLFEAWMYKLLWATVGRFLPGPARAFEDFCRSFVKALQPLRKPRVLLEQVLLTCLIWSMTFGTEWLMFRVFHLELGWDAAVTLVGAILIGMLIPGPPGFAGNFEAFTLAGLAIFGVTGGVALGYALMLHWVQFFQIFFMGMYFLWRDQIPFRSLFTFSQPLDPSSEGAQAPSAPPVAPLHER